MDFGAFPPELNSARIYTGPGSGPMMAAAAAWDKMAAELSAAEFAYQGVINGLVSEGWMGPASNAMAAAATPYMVWMGTTAAQVEQAAIQAKAAAAAFDAAYAMTVAPPLIVANRSQLAALVATNFLGQNAAAIAATEAHYGQMWAQDAAAMYGYAAASAAATKVTPFSAPHEVADPAGQAAQQGATSQAAGTAAASNAQSTLSQAMTNTPQALQALATPVDAPTTGGEVISAGDLGNAMTNLMSSSFSPMGLAGITQAGADIAVIRGAALAAADPLGLGAVDPMDMLLPGMLGPGGLGALGAGLPNAGIGAASASMGHAAAVGGLSVPQSWAAAVPTTAAPGTSVAATGWTVAAHAPEPGAAGMPGVPLAGAGQGRNYGFAAPRYGFKPTVMARPVVAG